MATIFQLKFPSVTTFQPPHQSGISSSKYHKRNSAEFQENFPTGYEGPHYLSGIKHYAQKYLINFQIPALSICLLSILLNVVK